MVKQNKEFKKAKKLINKFYEKPLYRIIFEVKETSPKASHEYEIKNNKRKIIHRDFLNAKTINEAHKKLRHEFPQSLIFIIEV